LLQNSTILEAAWLSLRIALVSSFAAVVLGTLAGYALARIKRFRGSTLFAGMVSAPMVMPDVITGLSMLFADYPGADVFAKQRAFELGFISTAAFSPFFSATPLYAWPTSPW
jgi:ABC-type spermidine/putrescine transport system permease subunit II